ncbi:DUF5665 domain-containing protein [Actibacterium sp. 188UL27-1]|uniref:DUF5665 domain-containing protein n=1 Tax=Actibacterium sp. 188UL27-1 TaxID=2786961 RepID=UPI00195CA133|nr:DUF5665 domain-containing protein [Actibacterium sp. 188UL27-1]MBM7069529.1 hypothetical protein [Actibacterium sp. 188UL27-1]
MKADIPDTQSEVAGLRAELARLNNHRFVRIHNSTWRLMFFQFLRGLSFGLGTVMGASILVSILVYLLSWVDFIPIIGEWATELARQIDIDR